MVNDFNEFDTIKIIAENLSERRNLTALSNYQVLNNNIDFVNNLFDRSLICLFEISNEIQTILQNDVSVSPRAKDQSCPLYYFRQVLPRLINNDIQISLKFKQCTGPDNRTNVSLENVTVLRKLFADYIELVTAARQFVDSLLSDSYQFICLEPKKLNYQVLSSLSSFEKYVTKSIWHSIVADDLTKVLQQFNSLQFNERANSRISKCQHKTFAQKVDYIFSQLGINDDHFNDELKNIFSFSSDFTHVGYVSTMFSSTYKSECIFGDAIGPYLPSTENFSELKFELLTTGMRLLSRVYLPSLKRALGNLIDDLNNADNKLDALTAEINSGLATRNSQYYFFIVSGLIESKKNIELPCRCGELRIWTPPHKRDEIFCKRCGSSFNLIEIAGDPGYLFTSQGPVKAIGSLAPNLEDLPRAKFNEVWKKWKEAMGKMTP
jgi:hypothetical protein